MNSISLDIFEANRKAFDKQSLFRCSVPEFSAINPQYQIFPCQKEGYYLQTPLGILNSKINSIREAEKTIQQQKAHWNHSQHHIIIGLELGYHTLAILSTNPHTRVWVLEPSLDIIMSAFCLHDFSDFIKEGRLSIFPVLQIQGLNNLLTHLPDISTNIFVHRPSYEQNQSLYREIKTALDSMINMKKVNIDTIDYFQRLWIPNIIRNIPLYTKYPGIELLKETLQGATCIVLAAGPSLENNIQSLKTMDRTSLCIIAVNTVVPRLLHEKIIPDIIIAIDPQNVLFYSFVPLFLEKNAVPILVAEPSLSPTIIRNYPGTVLFSGTPLFQELLHPPIPTKHRLDVGGSVSTSAYSLAVYLEVKEIFLMGLDLAYSKTRMHLRGNEQDTQFLFHKSSRFQTWESFGFKKASPSGAPITCPGFYGDTVVSDAKFKTYIDWLENRFSYYQHAFPTFNVTQGGIAFSSIPNQDLDTFLPLSGKTIKSSAISVYNDFQTNITVVVHKLEKLLLFFEKSLKTLNKIIKTPLSNISTEDLLIVNSLLESEWISIKTQKFFFEIENSPEKYLTPQEMTPSSKLEAIKQKTYQVLRQKTLENIQIIKRLLPYLSSR